MMRPQIEEKLEIMPLFHCTYLQPLGRKVLLPDVIASLPIHTVVPALRCVSDERRRHLPFTLGRRFIQMSDCVRAVMVQIPAKLILTEHAPLSFSSYVSPKD